MSIDYFGYYSSAAGNLWAPTITSTSTYSNVISAIPEPIDSDWALLQTNQMGTILYLGGFFDYSIEDAWSLRSDYVDFWDDFRDKHKLDDRISIVAAFNIMDEPTWNGVSAADLATACNLVKATYDETPIMIVEGWPSVSDIVVPITCDWLGFDQYYLSNPSTNATYLARYATIKAKRSANQKMVIVMDAFHGIVHTNAGISAADMEDIATDYYALATSDADVIAVLPFIWTDMDAGSVWDGTESLPAAVKAEHLRIGQLITGKPYDVDLPVDPGGYGDYAVNGTDLSDILATRSTTKIADVNYAASGSDLSNAYEKRASGDAPAVTNFKKGGADFNTLFCKK